MLLLMHDVTSRIMLKIQG